MSDEKFQAPPGVRGTVSTNEKATLRWPFRPKPGQLNDKAGGLSERHSNLKMTKLQNPIWTPEAFWCVTHDS